MQIRTSGNSDGWKSLPGNGNDFNAFLNADVDWVQFWVELRSPADAEQYHRFVDGYVLEEKKHGRFERPLQPMFNRNDAEQLVDAFRSDRGEHGLLIFGSVVEIGH